ncbi:carboxypeptidase [Bordetella sp. H567]|nr:carboxypeptidase [Bordetella sp. H567]
MNIDEQILALPFDNESMLARLREWVECESPSYDGAAVERMMSLAARDMAALGARIEHIPGRQGFGGCVRARMPHAGDDDTPGILIAGHLDTVHAAGVLERLPWRREGGKCYGPGILDMKGGMFIALEALRQLRDAGIAPRLPVTVLFTSDEEIGSPSTRTLIEREAARHRYVLIPEPARADGGLVVGRYAIARFNLRATGTPSHAGSQLGQGRSAIRVMAEKIIELEGLTCADFTFSVGVINGGKWVNCVPMDCVAEALTMAKTHADLERAIAAARALNFEDANASFKVELSATRPVWETRQGTLDMYELASEQAQQLGFSLSPHVSGGGSDGNFIGALGIPVLDGLGLRGSGMHTLHEHIEESSLVERGRLMAGLIARLG